MKRKTPDYTRVFAGHDEAEERAAVAKLIWLERVADLGERGLVTPGRLRTVDRYVRACVEYEFLYPTAMCEGPTRKSKDGGEYANMSWSAIGKLNEAILKFEDALQITLKAVADDGTPKPQARTKADDYLDA